MISQRDKCHNCGQSRGAHGRFARCPDGATQWRERCITLSGRNSERVDRTVFLDDVEVGVVRPSTDSSELWTAYDLKGQEHGRWWTRDWNAAAALTRIPRRASFAMPYGLSDKTLLRTLEENKQQ